MEKFRLIFISFVYLVIFACAEGKDTCSPSKSSCSTNEQCCAISNGKSFCNLKTKKCDALRYCDKHSSSECPFDDLSAKEIEAVTRIIKNSKSFSSQLHFPIVRKQEPKKQLWNSGDLAAKERIAYAAVYDLERNLLSEVLVSLSRNSVISVRGRKDSIPPITSYEYETATEVLKKDPRIRKAYERRGLNASNAAYDIWAFGADRDGNVVGRRRVKLVANYQDPEAKFMDWAPVEGLSATIDIADKKIVQFTDAGNVPVPKAPCIVDQKTQVKKEHSSQELPKSSIDIKGYQITWHNWKFQYSMDPVFGLQAYHIRYLADSAERFLIYKLSISEMFVPYGADGKSWRWRGAFDVGEYGLGKSASPLILGVNVPANAKLLSCPQLNDETGEVTELKGCIAVYEENVLPFYNHYGPDKDVHVEMRGTNLVVSFLCTVGNYDYIFDQVYTMDGNIEVRVSALGILLSRGVEKAKNDPNCIEDCLDFVNEYTVAPEHQHFFNYRIDFDIDGVNNLLTEVDLVNDPKGTENPDGGAFSTRRSIVRNESFRDNISSNRRYWSAINPQSRNRFNTPRGYSLIPGPAGFTFLKFGDPLNQALFITHPIWVSVYKDDEQAAAGRFPRSGRKDQGLPEYIKDQQSLDNTDLVVWHTFTITHSPRPEEFPFMNKMQTGFHIVSRNFQSANPNIVQCTKK